MWCLEHIEWFSLTDEEQAIYDALAIMIKKEHGETISKGMSNAAAIIGESNLESAEILGKVIKQKKLI